jgi:AbrB family looped-hinge helix DNA binding protein
LSEEPEIAIVGTKGQIVIPQQLREKLKIKPKTKLALYSRGDKIVVTKLEIPPLSGDLKELFIQVDKSREGRSRPTEREILKEIQEYRREVRHEKD